MNVTAWVVVLVSFGLASQLIVRITTAATPAHIPKGAAQTLSTYLVIAGLGGSALAVTAFVSQPSVGMAVAGVLGLAAAALAGRYLHQISRPNDTLIRAFGPGWDTCIPADRAAAMLRRRWRWALPSGAKPRWDRDIVYWKLPDTDRELLADVWQPPAGVARSGLGFVYLHAGYYQMLDKDRGTRPLFSHLARQGHVVMEVSYRLLDETDIFGMLDDVKRGIARSSPTTGARLAGVLPAFRRPGSCSPAARRVTKAGPGTLRAGFAGVSRRRSHAHYLARTGSARPATPHRRWSQAAPIPCRGRRAGGQCRATWH